MTRRPGNIGSREKWVPWDRFAAKNCPQMKSIRSRWNALLQKEKLHERYYHDFIARHAHIFFPMLLHSIQVISKIRLGAELGTDLVLVRDAASMGRLYPLVVVATPRAGRC